MATALKWELGWDQIADLLYSLGIHVYWGSHRRRDVTFIGGGRAPQNTTTPTMGRLARTVYWFIGNVFPNKRDVETSHLLGFPLSLRRELNQRTLAPI